MAFRATRAQIAALADGKPIKRPKQRKPTAFVQPSYANGVWTIPVRVVSESNQRCHWTKKRKRRSEQGNAVFLSMFLSPMARQMRDAAKQGKTICITFTKLGGKRLDVSNLPTAFKAVEDEVARLLGIDDGHEHWHPVFEQEPGGKVGIRIRIESIEGVGA